ncbi:MAG TPA: hypothetical protein VKT32_16350 [Chthonomonadaceae bacterium]|nr:hypothetical protein [Chthonomonadaceae bacterium]
MVFPIRPFRPLLLLLGLLCVLALQVGPAAASQTYKVTLLGSLDPGGSSQANAINSAGKVVGIASDEGVDHPFLWTPTSTNGTQGSMRDLGTFWSASADYYDEAIGINASGQVAGNSESFISYPLSSKENGFLWSGKLHKLGVLAGYNNSVTFGINASGQIVGACTTGYAWNFQSPEAFLYSGGKMIDLGALTGGATSLAFGINDAGEIYGFADTTGAGWPETPFIYESGNVYDMSSQLPGGIVAMNNAGQLAIERWVSVDEGGCRSNEPRAALWTPTTKNGLTGSWVDLGTGGFEESEPAGLNDDGDVVGTLINTDANPTQHAFLYHNGVMVDLNTRIPTNSGITLQTATGINHAGQIVGTGVTTDGRMVAFLLTPSS